MVFRSESDKNYPGMVSRIGRETDRETREFLVDVRVNELPKNWTIGQRAEVYIQTVLMIVMGMGGIYRGVPLPGKGRGGYVHCTAGERSFTLRPSWPLSHPNHGLAPVGGFATKGIKGRESDLRSPAAWPWGVLLGGSGFVFRGA